MITSTIGLKKWIYAYYAKFSTFQVNFLKILKIVKNRIRLGVGVKALSYNWGNDRGFPIHRYYLELFLSEFAIDIRGHCLEFQRDQYTSQFGKTGVIKLDILHQDHSNPMATLVADLTKPNDLPSDSFDCIICTHVLQSIYDLKKAVCELHRMLKPEGVLLVGVPNVSMCGPEYNELWRFTSEGLQMLLSEVFKHENITMRAYGNSLTTAGDFRGLVTHEFSRKELNYHDFRFASEICAKAVK